jgi:hypothetical protein
VDPASDSKSLMTYGFLTIIDSQPWGWCGGLLVLNPSGRPVEFHCTAPVKPTRAQEILYGPTLQPYLFGEQMAPALLMRAKSRLRLVLTDLPPVLAVRQLVSMPVVVVGSDTASASEAWSRDESVARVSAVSLAEARFELSNITLAVSPHYPGDRASVTNLWPELAEQIDPQEPFGRIREALEEAHKSARAA